MISSETCLELSLPLGARTVECECPSSEAILREALSRVTATSGAVVSMDRSVMRIEAVTPDISWLRSVDLYIARAILTKPADTSKPLLSATSRAYIPLVTESRTAVLILSDF